MQYKKNLGLFFYNIFQVKFCWCIEDILEISLRYKSLKLKYLKN